MLLFGGKKLDPHVQPLMPLYLIHKHHLPEFMCLRHRLPGGIRPLLLALEALEVQPVIVVLDAFSRDP